MFERGFEQVQPRLPETKKPEMTERAKKEIADFFLEVMCVLKNVLSDLEGKMERLSFGPEKDEAGIQACEVKKGLVQAGLDSMIAKAREMGVLGAAES